MKTSFETSRLLLRELLPSDDHGMFQMDSNPNVHRYLGHNPVSDIESSRSIIQIIRQQYLDHGIGRWAVTLKDGGEFIGWCGIKVERNVNHHNKFYDLGYRFREEFWGKGYAFEAANAFVEFGFSTLKLEKINAYTELGNIASQKILERCGFVMINQFFHQGVLHYWYEIQNPALKL